MDVFPFEDGVPTNSARSTSAAIRTERAVTPASGSVIEQVKMAMECLRTILVPTLPPKHYTT